MPSGLASNVRRARLPREAPAGGRTTPSVRDKTSYASTGPSDTSSVVPLPAGWVAGDVHYIFCQLTASTGAITTPTGYTAVVPQFDSENSTSAESAVFRKNAALQGGDGSVTITHSSGRFAAASLAVKDVDTSVFEDVAGASDNGPAGTATAIDAPTLTPANANSLLLTGHTGRRATVGEAVTYLPPSGMTEEVDVSSAVAAVSNASVEVASLAVLDTNPTGVKTATADLAVSASGMSVLVRGAPTGGGQTIAAGQVLETETAQVLGRLKVAAAAQATETETAQALTRVKTRAANQVVETEAAQAVGKAKVKAAAQALETETAQAVTARKTIAVGQAVEAETAQIATPAGVVGQAAETEQAQAISRLKVKAAAQATESETAQAVTVRKTVPVGQAVDTETAQAVGRAKAKTAGQAVETETAQAVTRRKIAAVGQVSEAETAQTIQSTGPKIVAVGQAVEAEQIQAIGRVKVRALAQAAEAEAAQALARLKVATVGQVAELETAQAITVGGGLPPPRWIEATGSGSGITEPASGGSGQVERVGAGSGVIEATGGV